MTRPQLSSVNNLAFPTHHISFCSFAWQGLRSLGIPRRKSVLTESKQLQPSQYSIIPSRYHHTHLPPPWISVASQRVSLLAKAVNALHFSSLPFPSIPLPFPRAIERFVWACLVCKAYYLILCHDLLCYAMACYAMTHTHKSLIGWALI